MLRQLSTPQHPTARQMRYYLSELRRANRNLAEFPSMALWQEQARRQAQRYDQASKNRRASYR